MLYLSGTVSKKMEKLQRVIFKGNISKFNNFPDDLTKYIYITFINESIKKYIWDEVQQLIYKLHSININVNEDKYYLIYEDINNIFKDEIFKTDINFSFNVLIDILKNRFLTPIPLSLFIENILLENEELINYLIENKKKNIIYLEFFEKNYNYHKIEENKYFKNMSLAKSMAMSWIMYIHY